MCPRGIHLCYLEFTFNQNYISSTTYLLQFTLARIYGWSKLHFPENLFSRIYTVREITFGRSYIFPKVIFLELLLDFPV